MKKSIMKMLGIAFLSMHIGKSDLQATVFNGDATIPNLDLPTSVITAAGLYVGYNYVTRQDFLVEKKQPMAYEWFRSMQAKYPCVFDDIHFLQTPSGGLIPSTLSQYAATCSWTRNNNRIFFSGTDLNEIALIYNKVIDGYALHDNEKLALARYEFMLLHEVGHLATQDAQSLIVSIVGLLGAVYGAEYVYEQLSKPISATKIDTKDKNVIAGYIAPNLKDVAGEYSAPVITGSLQALGFPEQIPAILSTGKGLMFIAGLVALLRHQEAQADAFACTTMSDTQTLQDALSLFENDSVDLLFELETKEVLPYIAAQSPLEAVVQKIAEPIEYGLLYTAQQIYLLFKQNATSRWLFDFSQNALNQGPSVRARMIKDEIARRQAQN